MLLDDSVIRLGKKEGFSARCKNDADFQELERQLLEIKGRNFDKRA
jgi:hypothetical protein